MNVNNNVYIYIDLEEAKSRIFIFINIRQTVCPAKAKQATELMKFSQSCVKMQNRGLKSCVTKICRKFL